MEELSRPTRSLVRADTGSTSYPSAVAQASGLTRGRSAVPGASDPGPKSCGDDQLSRPTLPGFELTRGHPVSRANAVPGPRNCGVHQLSRPTLSWSELTRAGPAVQADLDPGPRGCGVDQLSCPTPSRVRAYTGSTSCPGRIGPVPVGPKYRPTVPVDSRVTRARDRDSAGSTRSPGRFGLMSDGLRS